jgi:hypothetical protein
LEEEGGEGGEELVLSSFVVVFGPVMRTRIPGRKREPSDDARTASIMPYSVDHAGLKVEKHRAWYAPAARGLVVEHVDGVEMRVAAAKVPTVAVNAVFVAQHPLKLGAHLTTALARLQVQTLARRSSLEVGSTQEKTARRVGKCKKLRVEI